MNATAVGSKKTRRPDSMSRHVTTMSSPIASGHPPTSRNACVRYSEKAPWATSVDWYSPCMRFTAAMPR